MGASRNVIRGVIRGWIDEAAACQGGDVYLADARGSASISYARLLDVARETGRLLDDAGLPLGARIQVRLADPVTYTPPPEPLGAMLPVKVHPSNVGDDS